MNPYDWSKRYVKDTVRTALFEYIKTNFGTLTGYLCLPGWDGKVGGIDIHRGIELGAITAKTKIVGFEYRKNWAADIQKHFSSMPNVEIQSGMIEDGALEPDSIDFAFLDFTGTINPKLYQWLGSGFASSLKLGAAFAVTLSFGRREGDLFQQTAARLNTDLKGYRSALAKRFPSLWYDQPRLAVWVFILKCALRKYQNTLRDVLIYRDEKKSPMVVFLFEGIRPLEGACQYPELFVKSPRKEDSPMTMASAKKAHATRRTLAKKRSAAAKKAWRTRRSRA